MIKIRKEPELTPAHFEQAHVKGAQSISLENIMKKPKAIKPTVKNPGMPLMSKGAKPIKTPTIKSAKAEIPKAFAELDPNVQAKAVKAARLKLNKGAQPDFSE